MVCMGPDIKIECYLKATLDAVPVVYLGLSLGTSNSEEILWKLDDMNGESDNSRKDIKDSPERKSGIDRKEGE